MAGNSPWLGGDHQGFVQPRIPQIEQPRLAASSPGASAFVSPAKKRKVSSGTGGVKAGGGAGSAAAAPTGPPVNVDFGGGRMVQMPADKRVAVKHKVTGKKLAGTAAPKAKQLAQWLLEHPDFDVCTDPPGRSRNPNPKPRAPRPPGAPKLGRVPKAPRTPTGSGSGAGKQPKQPGQRRGGSGSGKLKVPWPLLDSLESGPAGMFISELRVLHREANVLYNAGHFEEANKVFQEALEMAKKAVDEFDSIEQKLDALPPVRLRQVQSAPSQGSSSGGGGGASGGPGLGVQGIGGGGYGGFGGVKSEPGSAHPWLPVDGYHILSIVQVETTPAPHNENGDGLCRSRFDG